jgi:hypothetical protein
MESGKKEKVIIKTGPNLVLFSIALLLAIFAAYSVGVLVSKKAEEKKYNDSKTNNETKITSNKSTNKLYSKETVSGKSFINNQIGPTEATTSIYYFYEDNTYYLQDMAYDEYGTYEIANDELVLYSLFSYAPNSLEPLKALGGKTTAKIEKGVLVFTDVDSEGNNKTKKYDIDSSNITGSLSNTMLKLQKQIDSQEFCD